MKQQETENNVKFWIQKEKKEKEARDKEFLENWETRELGYPPIKGDPTKEEQLEEKNRIIKLNQENYSKNLKDKDLIKNLYKNNMYATTKQVFNEKIQLTLPSTDQLDRIEATQRKSPMEGEEASLKIKFKYDSARSKKLEYLN